VLALAQHTTLMRLLERARGLPRPHGEEVAREHHTAGTRHGLRCEPRLDGLEGRGDALE
jgi:hypothetical protein